MTTNDEVKFYKLLARVADIFRHKLDESTMEIYFAVLKKYDLAQIRQACLAHIGNAENGHFMPKPADIIRIIDGKPGDKAEIQANEALRKFEDAMQKHGFNSVVFDDSIIHKVVQQLGGIRAYGMLSNASLPFYRKDFLSLYKSYLEMPPADYPKMLIGCNPSAPPRIVGNEAKALEVLHQKSSAMGKVKELVKLKVVGNEHS